MDSAELINKMIGDASPSEVSDYIKSVLYSKAGEKVDAMRPDVAAGLFGDQPETPEEPEQPEEQEVEAELDTEPETESEPEPEVDPEPQEEE